MDFTYMSPKFAKMSNRSFLLNKTLAVVKSDTASFHQSTTSVSKFFFLFLFVYKIIGYRKTLDKHE